MNEMAVKQQKKRESVDEQLNNKTYSAAVEIKDPWIYYDTYVLDVLTSPAILFNNAVAKTRSLSNYTYQQLPSGQSFDVTGVRVSYNSITALSDIAQLALIAFINICTFQIQINNKVPSYERNLGALIGGQLQVVTAPAVTVASRNLSVWTGSTVVKFRKKIMLDQTTQWTVNILKDAAAAAALTGDNLRVEMIGKLTARL
jgi:PhoPQ-activated pathogenicity-related protein